MNESWSWSWSWICPSWTKSRPTCISTTRTAPLRNPATPEPELVVCCPSFGRRVVRKRKRNREVSSFQFRHQLLPRPRRPQSRAVLFLAAAAAATAAPLPLLLPMPLSSAAPLTSLASIWIEAPCFSSYKSR